MHTVGRYAGRAYNATGELLISFVIEDEDEIEKLLKMADKSLVIDVQVFREARSLEANKFFWRMCDRIAKALKSDKWTIYKLQLSKYGVFVDVAALPEARKALEEQFRVVEPFEERLENGLQMFRCYVGSSKYNSKEMSDLIDGTVSDAKDIGIDTASPEEIDSMIRAWEGEYG